MAQIGTFTRAEDGSYTGTIKTLSLNIKARLLPAELSENEKAPPALKVGVLQRQADGIAHGWATPNELCEANPDELL